MVSVESKRENWKEKVGKRKLERESWSGLDNRKEINKIVIHGTGKWQKMREIRSIEIAERVAEVWLKKVRVRRDTL